VIMAMPFIRRFLLAGVAKRTEVIQHRFAATRANGAESIHHAPLSFQGVRRQAVNAGGIFGNGAHWPRLTAAFRKGRQKITAPVCTTTPTSMHPG